MEDHARMGRSGEIDRTDFHRGGTAGVAALVALALGCGGANQTACAFRAK
jgi:hypothetical protein